MTACGYTPDAIDAMAMHDVSALVAYWRDHPPAHEILAAVHGLAPRAAPDPDDPSNIGALIARAPDGQATNGQAVTGQAKTGQVTTGKPTR